MENNIEEKREILEKLRENVESISNQQAFLLVLKQVEVHHQRREQEFQEQLSSLRAELEKNQTRAAANGTLHRKKEQELQKQLDSLQVLLKKQQNTLKTLKNPNYSFHTGEDIYARFRFPWEAVVPGSRLVIYGGGIVGKTFVEQLAKASCCNIVAICDKDPAQTGIYELPVITLRELSRMRPEDYDMVLIAIEKKSVATEIKEEIEMAGIPGDKVRWFDPAKR